MDFVISVIHPVKDVPNAAAFLCTTLGFVLKDQAETALMLENGAVALRLVPLEGLPPSCLNLELHSQNLPQTTDTLLALPEVSLIAGPIAMGLTRIESRLQGPHGIIITLVQNFNEDQLDILPDLSTSLIWDGAAESCVKQMLRWVPIGFRDAARVRATEQAEMLAAGQASIIVALEHAVQALAETTPTFQHPALLSALQELGIDPGQHFHNPAL